MCTALLAGWQGLHEWDASQPELSEEELLSS